MLTLHHLNNSRSQRILWLLEELGVEYRIEQYQRDPQTMLAPVALQAIHPLGKAPIITDGDVVMAESGAIIDYLVQRYAPNLMPPSGTADYWQYVYWMHFAEGSLMPPMLMGLVLDKIRTSPMPFFARPVANGIAQRVTQTLVSPNLKRLITFIDAHLQNHPWFAGEELTGADFQMSFPLEAAHARGLVDRRNANIERFLRQISQRDGYQRALNKGGEYSYAQNAA